MNTPRPLVTITRSYFIAGVAKMFVLIVFVDSTSSAVGTGISATARDGGIHATSALANVFCH